MNWTISEVIEDTFRSFARNWFTLVVGNLVATLIALVPVGVCAALTLPPLFAWVKAAQEGAATQQIALGGIFVVMSIAFASALVLGIMFAPALSRMAIAAARDEHPRLGSVFDFRRAGTFLGAGLLAAFAVMGAALLLIVPGIIVGIGLSFVSFFVVDDPTLGALDALEASWKATRGHRLQMFGLLLLGGIASWIFQELFGLSVWLMPLQIALMLVSTPLSTLALAQIFVRIRPRSRKDASALPSVMVG